MTRDDAIVISTSVVTDDQTLAARTVEAFARTATGLALEGLLVSVTVSRGEQDTVDEP
jgi:hypothetical protein